MAFPLVLALVVPVSVGVALDAPALPLHVADTAFHGRRNDDRLEFPETPKPDYWDFAYFSIVIGMTFQVSDVQITSNYLRRVVLLHSVIAFFFNVFIIAITVNIVAGHSA